MAQFKLEWKPKVQGDGMSCLRHTARTRQLEGDGWAYSCAIAGGRAGVTLVSRVVWDRRRTPPAAAHRPASRPRDTLTSILDGRCVQQAQPCTIAAACRWLGLSYAGIESQCADPAVWRRAWRRRLHAIACITTQQRRFGSPCAFALRSVYRYVHGNMLQLPRATLRCP